MAAFDLTFSAPKSASVVFALAGTDVARTVVAAHTEAVAGSLSYLERHAITTTPANGPHACRAPDQRGPGRRLHARRQPEWRPAHPQPRRRGQPRARSGRALGRLRPARDRRPSQRRRGGVRGASACRIDARLSASGGAGGPGRSAEVEGVGPYLLAEFSSRSADIRRHMDAWGAHSVRGARIAWAATRPPKGRASRSASSPNTGSAGPTPSAPTSELETSRLPRGPAVLDEHRFAGVIALPAHGGAHRRDVVAAFGAAAADGATAPVVERLVDLWVPEAPPGVAEPLRTATDRGPGQPPPACSRTPAGRPRRSRRVARRRPQDRCLPGQVGSHPCRGAARRRDAGPTPRQRCRLTAWPIMSVPSATSRSPVPAWAGASL